ncbi:SDR family NAD(P)-dependent oxidoreductase [Aquirufa sp.]|jgi:NAD(P)-dependent dehydrogenase (short-subunit alcohol dehydrogenase family)|uniref:SDR family NAD(P)-dependent oxidoreductase n=1 Tax=Aquirufa sp. TaxID=2676249 RepID=UPI003783B580
MKKNYIVTGANSGIGLATCEKLLEKGNSVLGICRDISKADRLIKKFGNGSLKMVPFDLTDLEHIEFQINNFTIAHGKLDGLVHCAGIEETIPLTIYSSEKVEKIFKINVFTTIELLRIFSKKKYSNDNSSAVIFSSVMGVLGQVGKVGYCATKAALLGVVKASALELSKRKIRVNAILPGVVNTPMTQRLFSQIEQNNIDSIIGMHPLGIGEVADIVPLVEYLLSDVSRWMTGQSLIIDGGYSIQ